jgi:hypothetical protein
MSIRSVLGNWIARHNQLLWFRSNGQRLERSQVPATAYTTSNLWGETFTIDAWGNLTQRGSSTAQLGFWPGADQARVWQKRFYDFNVWSERKRIEKLRYMHRNLMTIS